jgi:hypothetical protein
MVAIRFEPSRVVRREVFSDLKTVDVVSMLLRLVTGVCGALDPLHRRQKFDQETKGKFAKTQHDEVMKRLRNPGTPLPPELEDVLSQHVDGIYDLIRRTRNEAGHPTGKRMERHERRTFCRSFGRNPRFRFLIGSNSRWKCIAALSGTSTPARRSGTTWTRSPISD